MKRIIHQRDYELLINLENWNGEKRYAKYHYFDIGGPKENYEISLTLYSGNACNLVNCLKQHKYNSAARTGLGHASQPG